MSLPLNKVITGDCTEVMRTWPSDSIDLVVTSPPYWGLRDYGAETMRVWGGLPECEHEWFEKTSSFNKQGGEGKQSTNLGTLRGEDQKSDFCAMCGAWRGSLGLEPHPQQFIDHLVEICREIRRVLKPSGTFWLNLGDTYYGSGGKGGQYEKFMPDKGQPGHYRQNSKTRSNWLQPKQKLMIPARVAIALQHDGWILRSDIIWHKPNHMPSSVKDRLTNAYEHIFLFAKQRRYYFDLDAVRVPHTSDGEYRNKLRAGREKYTGKGAWSIHQFGSTSVFNMGSSIHPKGKNPGDLWRIPTTPFPGAHFATFPPKLINPIIKAGSPRWICSKCGKPRTRITERTEILTRPGYKSKDEGLAGIRNDIDRRRFRPIADFKTVGWSDCGCKEKWIPGIVLDPFGGSGTVGQVARRLGRRFILIEIIPEYCKMAEQRVRGRYKPIPTGVVQLDQIMEAEK